MIKVNIEDLTEGMIVAEPILDITGKTLLAAKATLTAKHIEILKTWDIDFVRIKEPQETDEQLQLALAAEREKEQQVHKSEEVQKTVQEIKQPAAVPTPAIKKDLNINEETISLILKGETDIPLTNSVIRPQKVKKLSSLITQKSLQSYHDYLQLITKLIEKNFKVKDVALKEVSGTAKKLTEYITVTPGVIGYVLQPLPKNVNRLASHILGTSIVAGKIATLLKFVRKDVNNIVMGSLLHDIGRIQLPEKTAENTNRLTSEERQIYQKHVALGLGLLKGKNWIPKEVLLLIAQHHERIDGKGFPMGFKGDKIHPYAKIVAIADYFDKATHNSEKPSFNLLKIANDLLLMGDRFDLSICEIFREYLQNFLLSNKVKLDDGRVAEIVYMHQSFSEPVIRTIDGQFIDLNKAKKSKIKDFMV